MPVEAFFEEMKENFRRLKWVAVPGNLDDGVLFRYDRLTDVSHELIHIALASVAQSLGFPCTILFQIWRHK